MKPDRQLLFPTVVGWMGLVASPKGLRATMGPHATLTRLEAEAVAAFGPLPRDKGTLEDLARRLGRYVGGEAVSLDFELDMEEATPFRRAVWEALRTIPRGEVRTYREVAVMVGRPGAARAVGQAVGSNPFMVLVPCHRVVGSDGSLTGFGGGLLVKERLLVLEGRADAPFQRMRTETRKGFKPTRREQKSFSAPLPN